MAKNDFLSWDTTAGNNKDVGGVTIDEGCPPSGINNAIREVMAQLRGDIDGGTVYVAKSANYTAVANDNNAVLRFTATATLALTAVATLGANWHITVIANGGDVTIDPNASETIDGTTTIVIPDGYSALIVSSGSAFFTNKLATTLSQKAEPGHISGLVLTNNGSDATNDIDIATGSAASDAASPIMLTLSSALTKRLDASWSVGTNQGGLDTGSVGNNVYYIWLIQRSDTGVVDVLFSLSSTAPTMPTNYDRKRVIGSFARLSATNYFPRSYSQKDPTPWTAYTSVVTALGTVTAATFRSRVNGNSIDVMFNFTSGTANGSTAAFTLGVNGVSGNVAIDGGSGSFGRIIGGPAATNIAFAASIYVIGIHGATDVNFGAQAAGSGGLNAVIGTAIGSTTTIGGICTFPIQGWN